MDELANFEAYQDGAPGLFDDGGPYEDGEFMWYDYVLFTLTLLIALGIGVYAALVGDRQRSTEGYLMGNRALGTLPVAMSMFMSYISAILVLGNTAEMYLHGIQQWLAMIGSSLAYFLSGLIFVPLFFPLNITSSFEYLQMRYDSRAVKLTGTILLMISQVFYMGIAMYSPATALDAVTPIPTWASIIATGVVGTIYTTIGGMKAVVWTDVFQGLILLGGLIAVLVVGAIEVGGFVRVFDVAEAAGRTEVSFDPDPTIRMTFWSVIVGRTVSSMQTTGTGQTSVQRYCALPTKKKAVISVWLNIPFMLIVYSLTCLVGLTVFAYYDTIGCDPLRSNQIDNSNQLLPYFIVDVLKAPGLPGLFVAVLFSGCLSSVSSSMNSLSAVTWKDMLEPHFYYLPEWKKAAVTKLLAAGFGVLGILFAFFFGTTSSNVLQVSQSFVSGVAGPLLGMFVLASWFPWSNKWGALAGGWIGLAFNLVVILGDWITEPHQEHLYTNVTNCPNGSEISPMPEDPDDVFGLFTISFMWFSALGALTCVVIGLIVSGITGFEDPKKQDPLLIVPFFDRLFCCLPNKWLRKLWCGVPHDEAEFDDDGHAIKHMSKQDEEDGIELQDGDSMSKTAMGYETTINADGEDQPPAYDDAGPPPTKSTDGAENPAYTADNASHTGNTTGNDQNRAGSADAAGKHFKNSVSPT